MIKAGQKKLHFFPQHDVTIFLIWAAMSLSDVLQDFSVWLCGLYHLQRLAERWHYSAMHHLPNNAIIGGNDFAMYAAHSQSCTATQTHGHNCLLHIIVIKQLWSGICIKIRLDFFLGVCLIQLSMNKAKQKSCPAPQNRSSQTSVVWMSVFVVGLQNMMSVSAASTTAMRTPCASTWSEATAAPASLVTPATELCAKVSKGS